MERSRENGTCPSDLSTYKSATFTEVCGPADGGRGADGRWSPEWDRCARRVDQANKTVQRFNDFIRECRRSVNNRYRR